MALALLYRVYAALGSEKTEVLSPKNSVFSSLLLEVYRHCFPYLYKMHKKLPFKTVPKLYSLLKLVYNKVDFQDREGRQWTMKRQIQLKTKLFAIFLAALCVLVCFASLANYIIIDRYSSLLVSEISQNVDISSRTIDDVISQVEDVAQTISTNPQVQTYLWKRTVGDTTSTEYQSVYNTLNDLYFQRRSQSCIRHINIVSGSFRIGTYQKALENFTEEELLQIEDLAVAEKGGLTFYASSDQPGRLLAVKSILRIQNLSLENLGTLIIHLDTSQLLNRVTARSGYADAQQLLCTETGQIIYDSTGEYDPDSANALLQTQDHFTTRNGVPYIKVSTQIQSTGWYYTALVPAAGIEHTRNVCMLIFVLLSLTTLALLFAGGKRVIQSLLKGFDDLIVYMKGGKIAFRLNEDLHTGMYSSRELDELYNQFRSMADQINALIQENYEAHLLANEYKIQALSAQINPHFLYNTLDTLNWRAKANQDGYTSGMIEALGKILQKTLSNRSYFFCLRDELQIVEYYLAIQKMRYQTAISFEQEVDPSLLDCLIPRLTLQPLIENAIQESMRDIDQQCAIQLKISRLGKHLQLSVANSGSLFEEDFARQFAENQFQPHSFGIGLKNIEERLRLCYQEDFSMKLYNRDGRAVVEIQIPEQKKEANDVAASDCGR